MRTTSRRKSFWLEVLVGIGAVVLYLLVWEFSINWRGKYPAHVWNLIPDGSLDLLRQVKNSLLVCALGLLLYMGVLGRMFFAHHTWAKPVHALFRVLSFLIQFAVPVWLALMLFWWLLRLGYNPEGAVSKEREWWHACVIALLAFLTTSRGVWAQLRDRQRMSAAAGGVLANRTAWILVKALANRLPSAFSSFIGVAMILEWVFNFNGLGGTLVRSLIAEEWMPAFWSGFCLVVALFLVRLVAVMVEVGLVKAGGVNEE
ncbi:MAG: hypothetical protein AAF226_10710 [Verrucomicrobiota bacterium]